MIVAIELAANKARGEPYPWAERRGLTIYRHALTRGVLLRPIDNVVYFMPPYIITPRRSISWSRWRARASSGRRATDARVRGCTAGRG